MNVYLYRAALYCEACGQAIREKLDSDRPEGFDYDAARRAARQAYREYVKPAFRGGKRNPWGLERSARGDDESGCVAYLYVTVPADKESV